METPNWKQITEEFAAKSEKHALFVADAEGQAENLRGSDDYWEAVHTLAVQRINMDGTREGD